MRCRSGSTGHRRRRACGGRRWSTRFGTIKAWMGATHFLTRTLERVRTEMSLHVLAYNLKRVLAILGPGPLLRRQSSPEGRHAIRHLIRSRWLGHHGD